MYNPIYKFEITSVYGQTVNNKTVYPIFKNDVGIDWQIEQNAQYYRGKLSGKLNFIGPDFDFINSKDFETEFELRVFISYNAGASWAQYWTGKFYKTDCDFDIDNRKITVTPTVSDDYNEVIAGMEKEYDLIALKPEIQHVNLDKRPMIQVYSPGESVIACFLSGMWWEQDCQPETDEAKLTATGDGELNFAKLDSQAVIEVRPSDATGLPDIFFGTVGDVRVSFELSNSGYRCKLYVVGTDMYWDIIDSMTGVVMWRSINGARPYVYPYTVTLDAVAGTGAEGTVELRIDQKNLYGRYVLDVEKLGNINTFLLPDEDIISDNRNYRRVIGYALSNLIYYSDRLTSTPTEYGIYAPGQYYQPPSVLLAPTLFPIARSTWGRLSVWFAFSAWDPGVEAQGRKAYTLKDAYPLSSVISVLLGQIAPGVLHEPTTDYSQFLYSNVNPLSGNEFTLFVTAKSNVLAGDYDQPAQKAPVTLKQITDMLRDCFRCYWFIDKAENGDLRFRIEHISWFLKGGSYDRDPFIGMNLTQMEMSRNGKKWAFDTSKYSYDKAGMPERYQFGWMDDVTELFEGYPIDIQSKFVEQGNIEEINVANFTSDVDYMLLNPAGCSEDGFALMAGVKQNIITPDSSYQEVIIGVYEMNNYDLLASSRQITLTLDTKYVTTPGTVRIAFLDDSLHEISEIALFTPSSTSGSERTFSAVVPAGATKIGFTQITRTGDSYIQVKSGIGAYKLPYGQFGESRLQNAYMAFYYLQQFYMYDMPARRISANCVGGSTVHGVKKQKTQSLSFPVISDPNLMELIKTNMGDGQIQKLSINLSSREAKATLRYDTE